MIGNLEESCLLALVRSGPHTTAGVVFEDIGSRLPRAPSFGAVYTTLARMAAKGMVSEKYEKPEQGGRVKRYFTITGLGQKCLLETRAERNSLWDGIGDLSGAVV